MKCDGFLICSMVDYDKMNQWMKYLRRHEDNVFNAIFFDKENVKEEDILSIIADVSNFFSIPQPEISSKCNTFAEVLLGENANKCELSYNIEMLQKTGINNRDAFTLCFVHEMAHQMLFRYRFMLFCSERWIQELAADLTAGLYAERHLLATGKFKYALSCQKYSITHPDGSLRKKIVECGRTYLERMSVDGKTMMEMVIRMMPAFVYTHYHILESDWGKMTEELELPPSAPKSVCIEELPESNLLKQAIMKYRKQKDKDNGTN